MNATFFGKSGHSPRSIVNLFGAWLLGLRCKRLIILSLALLVMSTTVLAQRQQPLINVSRTPTTLTVGQPFSIYWSTGSADDISIYCSNGGPDMSPDLNGSFSGIAQASWVANPPVCTWSVSNVLMSNSYTDTLITVAAPANTNEAAIVGYSIPSSMVQGRSYAVSVTVQNTGNTTWTAGENYLLGSQNPQDNQIWGTTRVPLAQSVAPSQQYTFNFSVVAPAGGSYDVQWRMLREAYQWFGATASSRVTVSPATNNAQILSQNVPAQMIAGQRYPVSVAVRNTGNTTWISGGEFPYRLGSVTTANTSIPEIGRIALPNNVPPGGDVVFSFNMVPTQSGNFPLQWRMVQEFKEWFGDATVPVNAVVSQSAPTVTFTQPATDVTITATGALTPVTFAGTATPGSGTTIKALELRLGGVVFASGVTSVSAVKQLQVGTHVVELVATSASGLTTTVRRTVTISAAGTGSSETPVPVAITPPHLENPDAGSLPGNLSVGTDGAASYTMELVVPPGSGGLQPALSLSYSSNGSNGIIGLGWTLGGLSTIHRCPKTIAEEGFPGRISFDQADRLCLDGAKLGQSNAVGTNLDAAYWSPDAQYRTLLENFARITRLANGGFKVETKDGLVKYYGIDPDSAIAAQGRTDGKALLWALARVEDRSGNYYTMQYSQDTATGEYKLKQIRYGGNTVAGQTADLAVRFEYVARPDAQIQYMGGSRNDLRSRMTHIRTFINTDPAGNGGTLARDYELHYTVSASSGRSLVDWVQVAARNPTTNAIEYLPKTVFSWGDSGAAQVVVGAEFKLNVLNDGETRPIKTFNADIDGTGRTSIIVPWFDLLTPNGRTEFFNGTLTGRNSDGGNLFVQLALPTTTKIYTQIVPGDLNGDGRDDLVLVATNAKQWAYCLATEPVNNSPAFLPCVDATASLVNKNLISSLSPPSALSLRNDGKAQVVWFNERTTVTTCDLSTGGMTCSAIPASISIPAGLPVFGFSPIELSKQGMTELYSTWVDQNNVAGVTVCRYLSTGLECRNLATGIAQGTRPVVGDLNGDSLTDFTYYGPTLTRCLSTESSLDCAARPLPNTVTGREFLGGIGDPIGDGVQRLLMYSGTAYQSCRDSPDGWICQKAAITGPGQTIGAGYNDAIHEPVFIDQSDVPAELTCDAIPQQTTAYEWLRTCVIAKLNVSASQDKIVAVVNGFGLREEVTYARGDDAATYRRHAVIEGVEKRPVYPQLVSPAGVMVKELRRDNGQAGWLRTTYRYEGAMRDGHGRGSLGFALMQSLDHQSGITTTSTFDQAFPFVGVARTVRRTWLHCILEQTVNSPAQEVFSMGAGGTTHFPYIASTSQLRRDASEDCHDLGTVETNNQYTDGWGNLNRQVVVTSGAGRTFRSDTRTSFMTGSNLVHLSGLPTSVITTKTDPEAGSITRTMGYTYNATTGLRDTETIEPGNAIYEVVTTFDRSANTFGLVNKVIQRWRNPSCLTQYCEASVLRTVSDTTFDAKGRFATSIKNALGQLSLQSFDAQTGGRTSLTDPNLRASRWTLDSFGRVQTELRPDGNETRSYLKACAGDCPPDTKVIQISEQFHGSDRIAPPVITYADSDGRVRRTKTWGFNGQPIVTDQRYDFNGRLSEVDHPRFENASSYRLYSYLYDSLNRITSTDTIDEAGTVYTSTATFHGLTSFHSNAKSQIRIEHRDVLGRLRQVQDSNTAPGPGRTSFDYDAFDNLIRTIDANGNIIAVTYDTLGRRIELRDPDLGVRRYSVDPIGQVYAEASPLHGAKGKTSISHDMLGRMTVRKEPELESHWVYDTAANGIGQLAEAYTGPETLKDYRRTHTYDAFGRPLVTTQMLTDANYVSKASYDLWGRPVSQTYQRGADAAKVYALRYNKYGHLARIERGALVLWEVTAKDASLRSVNVTQGNGLTQSRSYNRYTGRLENAALTTSAQVARLQEAYLFDPLGNVRQRTQYWDRGGFEELFTYDSLNRLATSSVGANEMRYTYDAVGNITSKTGVGVYTYPGQGEYAVRPHAVQSVSGIPGSFEYDTNGNQTLGGGRTASWTSFDMPIRITKGAVSANFVYGPEHQRVRQIRSDNATIIYAGAQEVEVSGGNRTVKTYWPMGVGVEIDRPGTTEAELSWMQVDRLGSPVALTDATGALREKLEYDAWGKRRSADDHVATPDTLDGRTDNRGFTGHEMLDQLDLVHMNGRVYDPRIGRFMSGDPLIADLMNGQNYNRYSYVSNNPTNLTDPTGFLEDAGDSKESSSSRLTLMGGGGGKDPFAEDPGSNKSTSSIAQGAAAAARGESQSKQGHSANSEAAKLKAMSTPELLLDGLKREPLVRSITEVIVTGKKLISNVSDVVSGDAQSSAAAKQDLWQNKIHYANGLMAVGMLARGSPTTNYYRGARPGANPSFVPRPIDFKVDPATGFVKDTYGVSIFDNPGSLLSKGFEPHQIDLNSMPDSLQIIQRGGNPRHFEITPRPGANLTPQQFISACTSIVCK
jgi:RHS repeat-associated protein